MFWSPPRKYKGYRTNHTHAIKVTLPQPDYSTWRSTSMPSELTLKGLEMEDWCEENCQHNWSTSGYCTWYFDRMSEAVMFKMTFGGR